jgi:anti-sigma factor RsiW
MKPQNLHAHEDRLLDFAYGELPAQEALAVESHLQGCTRCTELLEGIRGVRTTMAQLPMEPAPDAGLDSLLAYAQQAARNAAAGPAPRPTWWRRWLVPAMGVTAVSALAIVSIQVRGKVNLEPELVATSQSASKQEPSSVASPPPEPAMRDEGAVPAAQMPAAPAPVAEATPPSEPTAKLDTSTREKFNEAPRKKAMKPSTYAADSDWSNAGAGLGRAAERDAEERKDKDYTYDRRDAMTQAGAFQKPKPMLVPRTAETASATPAPTAAPVQAAPPPPPPAAAQPGGMPADEYVASAEEPSAPEAEVQQQGPSRGSLRLSESKREAAKTANSADDDFDALFGSSAKAKREPRTVASAPSSPSAGAGARGRAENQGPSSAELSKLATAALRKGDRVREALYLRQALNAGATGTDRLGLLNRLCDAEFAIGRRDAAIEACSLVLQEDPRSSAAQVARRRLEKESPAQAKPDSRLSAPKSSSGQ